MRTADGQRYGITEHAIERYIERVRPALDKDAARAEVTRMCASVAVITTVIPEWIAPWRRHKGTDAYLMLGEDIAMPMTGDTALTCLTRAQEEATSLAYQRKARKAIKGAAKARSSDQGKKARGRAGKDNPTKRRREWNRASAA